MMTSIRSRITWLFAALALIVTGMGSAAWADAKIYSGQMCEAFFTANAPELLPDFRNGGIRNATNGSRSIVCPIIRDDPSTTIKKIEVRVANAPGSPSVQCTAFAYAPNGSRIDVEQASFRSRGNGVLTLGSLDQVRDGAILLECSLPPRTTLIQYLVGE